MKYNLFIDDLRCLADVKLPGTDNVWHIARTSQEALQCLETMGCLPEFISFDHDLGGADTTMVFLRWLEYSTDYIQNSDPPGFQVHSSNPAGKLNIVSFMESWKKCRVQ